MALDSDLVDVVLADSATRLPAAAAGRVVVSGSHGGRYPGSLAALAKVRAIILNDAGIGKDEAGIASLVALESLGIAATTVSHQSCRIGLATDMMTRGVISRANALARAAGVAIGDTCRASAIRLCAAQTSWGEPQPLGEQPLGEKRSMFELGRRKVVLIDSASLVEPADRGAIVITGSHGGLVGGDPTTALRVDAFVAVFNDAGVGIDEAGVGRLIPLNTRGIAAFTVAAGTARIGEARSTYGDGVVSRANESARRLGVSEGDPAALTVERLAQR